MIDVIAIILCVRIIYIAVSRGILKELFKIVGLMGGLLFAFQWYPFLTDRLQQKLLFVPVEGNKILAFISFLVIFFGSSVIFSLVSMIVTSLFKKEEISVKEKRVAFFMGLVRFAFLYSVLLFAFYLSPVNAGYFQNSFSCRVLKNLAPALYVESVKVYNHFNHLNPNEEVKKYYEIKGSLSKGDKVRN